MLAHHPVAPRIRPHIGTRVIDGKLCLLNQRRAEAWLCAGASRRIWQGLQGGQPLPQIAAGLAARYGIGQEVALRDTAGFVEELWKRQIVDLPDRAEVTDAARAALVTEPSHNTKASGKLYELALRSNTIYIAWLDLLIPCNLRCRHCYLDFSKTDVLPLPKVRDILDQLAAHGAVELILTGGEIFIRKDLLDIIAHADADGFLFDLYTNGNFIDEKMADRLAQFAIQRVQISVYGTSAETHEGITRKPGTFEKSVNAVRFLTERGIRVRMQCHIQRDNFEDAFNFPAFAEGLGAEFRFDTKLIPNRTGSTFPMDYGVTVAQQAALYERGLVDRLSPKSQCTASASRARINAAGDVYPCDLISNVVVGNLYHASLEDIWRSTRREELREDILGYGPGRCGSCGHKSDCNPCAALRGYNIDGHLDDPVSEACLITTASLLSRRLPIQPNSPAGVAAARHGGSLEHVLTSNAGDAMRQSPAQTSAS
jgi:radical SAM protein with 4Fe4S-binding SPASM domain